MAVEKKIEIVHHYRLDMDNENHMREYQECIRKLKEMLGEDNVTQWMPDYFGKAVIDYKYVSKEVLK